MKPENDATPKSTTWGPVISGRGTAPESTVSDGAPLDAAERADLGHLEEIIQRGIRTFVEVGNALAEVCERRLYRDQFGTFATYCETRWGLTRGRVYQLISAAEVVSTVVDAGHPAPENERQARELGRVPERLRAEVWRQTQERTGGKPTAEAVRETAARHLHVVREPENAEAERRAERRRWEADEMAEIKGAFATDFEGVAKAFSRAVESVNEAAAVLERLEALRRKSAEPSWLADSDDYGRVSELNDMLFGVVGEIEKTERAAVEAKECAELLGNLIEFGQQIRPDGGA